MDGIGPDLVELNSAGWLGWTPIVCAVVDCSLLKPGNSSWFFLEGVAGLSHGTGKQKWATIGDHKEGFNGRCYVCMA